MKAFRAVALVALVAGLAVSCSATRSLLGHHDDDMLTMHNRTHPLLNHTMHNKTQFLHSHGLFNLSSFEGVVWFDREDLFRLPTAFNTGNEGAFGTFSWLWKDDRIYWSLTIMDFKSFTSATLNIIETDRVIVTLVPEGPQRDIVSESFSGSFGVDELNAALNVESIPFVHCQEKDLCKCQWGWRQCYFAWIPQVVSWRNGSSQAAL